MATTAPITFFFSHLMKFLLIVMAAILDGRRRVLMSQIILKVGEPKIISAQGSEQNILM
jgi:hypothetical protein